MLILQVHCRYRSGNSGEDVVVEAERQMLVSHGHEVSQFIAENGRWSATESSGRVAMGLKAIWNSETFQGLMSMIRDVKPDVVHVHNTFAALSPSVFWAAKRADVPVVLTLHNYRLVCATSTLLRNRKPCEACVGTVPLPAVYHRCRYGGSFGAGLVIAVSSVAHKLLKKYCEKVDAFIVLTDFQKAVMIRAGLPPQKIHVKPNFVNNLGIAVASGVCRSALLPEACNPCSPLCSATERLDECGRANEVVFIGQINAAKGVDLLLEAWSRCRRDGYQLRIIGDGAELDTLRRRFSNVDSVCWEGRVPHDEVGRYLRKARWLILPSRWYECFPMVVVEALASGTPVIVPNHGPFQSMVRDEESGLLFEANNEIDLAGRLDYALSVSRDRWRDFSLHARADCHDRFSDERNYSLLMNIYEAAGARVG